jgi:signal transduction histidine kinase
MTLRYALASTWLTLGLLPLVWWAWTRRHVDLWHAMPVPLALLDRDGHAIRQVGPATEADLTSASGLPVAGRVARARSSDGTPLALTGLRRGGAIAVALPADPVGDRRDRVLAELGARLAHDINTPLAALQGHLDLLTYHDLEQQAVTSVRTCQRELSRLQTTAQDLLTYTRLRAGGSPRHTHLAGALAEEAAFALLDHADALDATIEVHVPAELVLVAVAEAELVRALRNLITNALTHGLPEVEGQQREVIVTVDNTPDTVTFAVADSGPGLTSAQLADLCQPLVRGPDTRSPGSGLGLAIVAEVLAGHGSSLHTGHDSHGRAELSFALPRLP